VPVLAIITTLLEIQVTQRRVTEEFDREKEEASVSEFNVQFKNFLEVTGSHDGHRVIIVHVLAKVRNESSDIQVKNVNVFETTSSV
jgi:hypothetical protein